jgi:hypothetical protein
VTRRLAYLDSSAYVKLPLEERGVAALLAELGEWDGYVSSALLATESIRACARYGLARANVAREWLTGLALLPLHLATALEVRDYIGAFVTYDTRLGIAAREHGLPVVGPA